ncbi:hypothetical protein Ocin01_13718 [Orchesella cincta]|uniref:Chitin-binding type-4 domain-containing protein n=1 Tax=Orchesella cincta TaxID=48709 RepID=A0A1D2MIY5_ORCCI|nr:hypothetical protein Ocin01_13718 [Orchesella cincta]
MSKFTIILITAFAAVFSGVNSHGRFMKPPNRSSIWRVPQFQSQNPPQNYNDMELFCGGVHQADNPGTNCGVCGDPQSQGAPRDNEVNGKWYRGIITGRYSAGQVIDIEVELTQQHKGYMEWRLCTNPRTENQACFNRYVLQLANGSGTRLPVTSTGMYRTQLRLPAGVRCNQCIIQWNYRSGNNWGDCGNGSGALGCGPQETFRGCSDISIS